MKKLFVICYLLIVGLIPPAFAQGSGAARPVVSTGETVEDVSDPTAVKIKTPDKGVVVSGTLRDTIANYPQLKDKLIAETTMKLEGEDEISAVHRASILAGQKIDLPKTALDKHNARIAKFAQSKENALNTASRKAREAAKSVKIDITASQADLDKELAKLNESRILAQKAKAKKDELVGAGIPISKSTSDAIEAIQPRLNPTPTPAPTPNDGL
jgi:hypothetical protein